MEGLEGTGEALPLCSALKEAQGPRTPRTPVMPRWPTLLAWDGCWACSKFSSQARGMRLWDEGPSLPLCHPSRSSWRRQAVRARHGSRLSTHRPCLVRHGTAPYTDCRLASHQHSRSDPRDRAPLLSIALGRSTSLIKS